MMSPDRLSAPQIPATAFSNAEKSRRTKSVPKPKSMLAGADVATSEHRCHRCSPLPLLQHPLHH
ncbi:hypothetical protein TYRP_013135 [Tyrophagus putrescentiae]|nr:hypothetical protein TYRP_013135 [Tyrophagus putrescentiae]